MKQNMNLFKKKLFESAQKKQRLNGQHDLRTSVCGFKIEALRSKFHRRRDLVHTNSKSLLPLQSPQKKIITSRKRSRFWHASVNVDRAFIASCPTSNVWIIIFHHRTISHPGMIRLGRSADISPKQIPSDRSTLHHVTSYRIVYMLRFSTWFIHDKISLQSRTASLLSMKRKQHYFQITK